MASLASGTVKRLLSPRGLTGIAVLCGVTGFLYYREVKVDSDCIKYGLSKNGFQAAQRLKSMGILNDIPNYTEQQRIAELFGSFQKEKGDIRNENSTR